MSMANETYDRLAFFARVILPAAGTLYFALAKVWGLPYGVEIVGTIAAVVTFLSTCLKISSDKYKKYIEEDEEGEG